MMSLNQKSSGEPIDGTIMSIKNTDDMLDLGYAAVSVLFQVGVVTVDQWRLFQDVNGWPQRGTIIIYFISLMKIEKVANG